MKLLFYYLIFFLPMDKASSLSNSTFSPQNESTRYCEFERNWGEKKVIVPYLKYVYV